MTILKKISLLLLVVVCLGLGACIKNNDTSHIVTPPIMAEFATVGNVATGNYFIKNDPNSVYMLPVGISTRGSGNTNVTFTVSSPTGAVSGQQYTSPTSITLANGKLVDSIPVKGLFAGYPTGRKDTLVFTITGGDAAPFPGYNVFKLITQKYCDVVPTDLVGNFASTKDYYNGAPSASAYTAVVSNWTSIGATKATVKIQNLGASPDNGFGPFQPTDGAATGLTVTLDWTNPASFTASIGTAQSYMANAFGYGPATVTATGSFSSCDQTITLTFTVKVSAGSFTPITAILKK